MRWPKPTKLIQLLLIPALAIFLSACPENVKSASDDGSLDDVDFNGDSFVSPTPSPTPTPTATPTPTPSPSPTATPTDFAFQISGASEIPEGATETYLILLSSNTETGGVFDLGIPSGLDVVSVSASSGEVSSPAGSIFWTGTVSDTTVTITATLEGTEVGEYTLEGLFGNFSDTYDIAVLPAPPTPTPFPTITPAPTLTPTPTPTITPTPTPAPTASFSVSATAPILSENVQGTVSVVTTNNGGDGNGTLLFTFPPEFTINGASATNGNVSIAGSDLTWNLSNIPTSDNESIDIDVQSTTDGLYTIPVSVTPGTSTTFDITVVD